MHIHTALEIPAKIAAGLASGELARTGGVIRKATGKPTIVHHLREASLSPQPLGGPKFGGLNWLLNFGSVASILNLGATVAFGFVTLRKLDKISNQLSEIDRKLEKVAWTVERVYEISKQIWNEVAEVRSLIEEDIQAGVMTASELAIRAQALEPGDFQRTQLFTAAQENVGRAGARLRLKARREIESATGLLDERRKDAKYRFLTDHASLQKTIDALRGYRLTVGTLSLKSLIGADAGFLREEIRDLKSTSGQLTQLLVELGRAFFRPKHFCTYDYLLNRYFGVECSAPEKRITVTRLARLAKKVDPTVKDVDDLIEQLQEHEAPDYHRLNERSRGWEAWIQPLPTAFYELEKAFEDCDRLQGHLAEFEFCEEHQLSIQEYRGLLEVNELPEDGQLVYTELAA